MPPHDARLVEYGRTYRPRVSRETRRLLLTASISLVVLWALAQVRFPDRPSANPVQPLLTQITMPATLDDLAADVASAQARIDSFLVPLHAPAMRLRDNVAVVTTSVGSAGHSGVPAELLTYDVVLGIAVVRVPTIATARPEAWTPQRPERPRYLLVAEMLSTGLYLRPVFVSAIRPVTTAEWPEAWMLPPRADVTPGTWLFTTSGEVAGLAAAMGDEVVIVPASLVAAEAERMLSEDALQAANRQP